MTPRLLTLVLLFASLGCSGAATGSAAGPPGPANTGDESPPSPDAGAPLDEVLHETRQPVVEVEERLDTDSDGLLDGDDLCPGDPEDHDGDRDEDGCPEASVSDAPVAPKAR